MPAVPQSPVYRCNCPSRQFPCKHSLGLLYAFVQGKPFAVADVPDEIAAKRNKAAVRVEKKKEEAEKPKVINKAAHLEKCSQEATSRAERRALLEPSSP